ncbi:MotA/TolQ/ExbB proton channel family protein [Iningainema tapete]|uniref:MotA/TolQ/ExbB proton channel family protein n=1 Tax=Iningainema tapete BLCC-T55 TaxID=2748662 RepID=A0A8J6XFU6_9CYAN|nr:MotA/TolQ/ExbB proton channel family protein [Iningainema tapete]MBD2772270.1 MotA/TolQ/ExbB proton channel family protein [Iningainema tapete BLCC-T55]
MNVIFDTFIAGGLVMWPLLGLFVATLACAVERTWFWFKLKTQQKQVAQEVLTAAKDSQQKALEVAELWQDVAVGRVMVAPLRAKNPTAEIFHLAIAAASDQEFVEMRRGDRLLESVMAIAPLLGILGTASGLMTTFSNLKDGNVSRADISSLTAGIGQALISAITAMTVAIIAFIFLRIFVILRSRQIDFFSQVGNKLELIYLQDWHQPSIPTTEEVEQKPNVVVESEK